MTTTFSNKVDILADYAAYNDGNAEAEDTDFWREWQSTITTCLYSSIGWVTINEPFYHIIEQAWDAFCEFLEIDKYGEYENISEVMEMYREGY